MSTLGQLSGCHLSFSLRVEMATLPVLVCYRQQCRQDALLWYVMLLYNLAKLGQAAYVNFSHFILGLYTLSPPYLLYLLSLFLLILLEAFLYPFHTNFNCCLFLLAHLLIFIAYGHTMSGKTLPHLFLNRCHWPPCLQEVVSCVMVTCNIPLT